jgi:hypothetical protein
MLAIVTLITVKSRNALLCAWYATGLYCIYLKLFLRYKVLILNVYNLGSIFK